MNGAIKLRFKKKDWLRSVGLEQNYLTIATTKYHFISCDSFNCLNPFGAGIYIEGKNLVFYLETNKIATSCTCKKEVLSIFTISQASVVSDQSSCVDQL